MATVTMTVTPDSEVPHKNLNDLCEGESFLWRNRYGIKVGIDRVILDGYESPQDLGNIPVRPLGRVKFDLKRPAGV